MGNVVIEGIGLILDYEEIYKLEGSYKVGMIKDFLISKFKRVKVIDVFKCGKCADDDIHVNLYVHSL